MEKDPSRNQDVEQNPWLLSSMVVHWNVDFYISVLRGHPQNLPNLIHPGMTVGENLLSEINSFDTHVGMFRRC